MRTTLELQRQLRLLGYDVGPADGALGPTTRKAIREFQTEKGLVADGVPGPRTWAAIDRATKQPVSDEDVTPPWIDQMLLVKGLHEGRNFAELYAWLKSAGSAVNPKTTAWCGDAVETAIRRALPDETLPANPFASIAYLEFGVRLDRPAVGAVLVFWRGRPDGWQGHVGFYVGEDEQHYFVLGGNQSDAITITKIRKRRIREGGVRWPRTYPMPKGGPVVGDGSGLAVTENEA